MTSKPDAVAELQRLKLMQDMQKELTDWAKSRLGWLSVSVAVLGFFGLSTVVNQAVQNLVSIPVQKQTEKLEEAREKAASTVIKLQYLSESVNKSGQDALAAANDARTKSREVEEKLAALQTLIDQAKTNITEAESQSKLVVSTYENVKNNISGVALSLFDKSRQQSLAEKKTAEHIEALEKKQSEIVAMVRGILLRDPQYGPQSLDLIARLKEIDQEYQESLAKMNKRNSASIVLVAGKGDANEKAAKSAEKFLQSYGYFASVIYPYGSSNKERIEDFERDFAGLKIDGSKGSPVIYINENLAENSFYEADIRSILDLDKIEKAEVVLAKFSPAEQYLRRSDVENFNSANIIVCYFPWSAS
jgi:DNA repair exonuclease SbcCD ATPase subunit